MSSLGRRLRDASSIRVIGIAGLGVVLVGFAAWGISGRGSGRVEPDGDLVWDAGSVFADERPELRHEFRITNRTNRVVRVVKKSCTCTCTETELSRDVLEPGQSATLAMAVRLPGGSVSGNASVRCGLVFDDGATRTCVIAYRSFPRIQVARDRLDLGLIGPDVDESDLAARFDGLETAIDLFAPAGQVPGALRPIESPEGFVAEVSGPEDAVVGRSAIRHRRYRVRFRPRPDFVRTSPNGSVARTVTFQTDDGWSGATTLGWRKVDRYQVTPSPVSFGIASADGSRASRRILVTAPTGRVPGIESIESDSADLVVERVDAPTDSDSVKARILEFVLSVPAGVDQRVLAGTVRITMTDPEATVLSIPWSAFVRRRTETRGGRDGSPAGPEEGGTR